MAELSPDDLASEMGNSLWSQQLQRQNEMMESVRENTQQMAQSSREDVKSSPSKESGSRMESESMLGFSLGEELSQVGQDALSEEQLQAQQETLTILERIENGQMEPDQIPESVNQLKTQISSMSQGQIESFSQDMEMFVEQVLSQEETGGQTIARLETLTSLIENEIGQPLQQAETALTEAESQMSLGELISFHFESFRETLGAVMDAPMQRIGEGLQNLGATMSGVFEGNTSIVDLMTSAITAGMGALFGGTSLTTLATTFGSSLMTFGSWLIGAITTAVTSPITGSILAITAVLGSIGFLADWFTGGDFSDEMASTIEGVPVLGSLYKMAGQIPLIGTAIQRVVDPLIWLTDNFFEGLGIIKDGVMNLVSGISESVGNLVSGIGESITQSFNQVLSWGQDVLSALSGVPSTIVQAVKDLPGSIWSLMKSGLQTYFNAITGIPNMILSAMKSAFQWAGMDGMVEIISRVQTVLNQFPKQIMTGIQKLPGMIFNVIKDLPTQISNVVTQLPGMLWNKISQLPSLIAKSVKDSVSAVVNTIPGVNIGGGDEGEESGEGEAGWGQSIGSTVGGAVGMGGLGGAMGGMMSGAFSSALSGASSVVGFQQGGVIDEPTVGIGLETGTPITISEQGQKEAVVPMESLDSTPAGGESFTEFVGGDAEATAQATAGSNEAIMSELQKQTKMMSNLVDLMASFMSGNNENNVGQIPEGESDWGLLRIARGQT